MEAITDVREISRIAYGFMASRALFAALEIDLFTLLSGHPKSAAVLAAQSGISENRLLTLLVSLVSVGLLSKDGDLFANSPGAESFLVRGAPKDYGEYLRVVNGKLNYRYFMNLDEALRGNRLSEDAGFYAAYYSKPEEIEEFTRAQHAGSLGPAVLLSRRADLSGCRTLLDVGGGSGAFTIALCQRNPTLRATILDFPEIVDIARRYAKDAGLESRIATLAGNALHVDWPTHQDAVLMSYVWSAVGQGDLDKFAERAYEALVPGGRVLVHDFMVNDDHTGPPVAAWHLLASTINNPQALCLTPQGLTERLRRGGFNNVSVEALIPGITSLAIAERPTHGATVARGQG